MEWLNETQWLIILPIFLIGFAAHNLGRIAVAMGCWLLALLIGLASIGNAADKIATFNKYPNDQSVVWGETALIFFTGFLAFPVIRSFLSGTKTIEFFSPKQRMASKKTST